MGRNWTREEEILALVLYCELPFGKVHASNPDVKKLAELLDRSPASVSMKMCNFARFDPTLQSRGVSGLANGSKLDEEVWREFNGRWSDLVRESQEIRQTMGLISDDVDIDDADADADDILLSFPEGTTRKQLISVRENQRFFRKAVLSSYENKCCITGISIPELLVASHIKPWRASDPVHERTNPTNGLCLNALHDKAFDRGLITITPDYRVVISSRIHELYSETAVSCYFQAIEGKVVTLPNRFAPATEFLEYHNDVVFVP